MSKESAMRDGMARRRHAQSRDLGSDFAASLLGVKADDTLEMVSINLIDASPYQPRSDFGNLEDLANSIKETGQLVQPVILRQKLDRYELMAGERRWRAAKLAGLEEVQAVIRNVDDNTACKVCLAENLSRKDLADFEKARSVRMMLELDPTLNNTTCGQFMGKSPTTIARLLSFFELPQSCQEIVGQHPHCLSATFVSELLLYCDQGLEELVRQALVLAADGRIKDRGILLFIEKNLTQTTRKKSVKILNDNETPVVRCTPLAKGGFRIVPLEGISDEDLMAAINDAVKKLKPKAN